MYFSEYNPTLHDPYIYGAGNTGHPIALNPNCLLYDARESYRAISRRYRDWDRGNGAEGSPIVPPGTPISLYPNYYNNNEPIYTKLSEEILGCSTHFTVFFCRTPAINILPYQVITDIIKQDTIYETEIPLGIASVSFWNNDFTGFVTTTDFQLPYNWLTTQQPGGITFSYYREENGQTYYKILNNDHGVMKKNNFNGSNGLTGEFLKSIHPFSLFSFDTLKELYSTQYVEKKPSSSLYFYFLKIPVENVYFWGGNDTIVPVDFIRVTPPSIMAFSLYSNFNYNDDLPLITQISAHVKNARFWPGDSSGLILYKKENKLYSLGNATTASHVVDEKTGENYGVVSGPAHNSSFLPNLKYFLQDINISLNYFFSNKTSKRIATKIQFKKITQLLNNTNNLLEQKKSELN